MLDRLDRQTLPSLDRAAREGPSQTALRDASTQFEAMLIQMLLKAMRAGLPAGGLLGQDPQTHLFTSLLDQQRALDLARGRGLGLADMLVDQLGEGPTAGTRSAEPAGATGFSLAGVPRWSGPVVGMASLPHTQPRVRADLIADPVRLGAVPTGEVAAPAERFVAEVWPHARAAARVLGIPAHFLVAQAALETGWGEKILKTADGVPSNNLFNIKADTRWPGATLTREVREYRNGHAHVEHARFRIYPSFAESFADYADLITTNARYAEVIGQQRPEAFARGLQQAGFATDPMYAHKLVRIIEGKTLRAALAAGA
ncbi:MAG: flagellar assembly peptidoglycan hydrolase FlgJ [Sphingobacteriia bacterium]|nr:flagellar assembly peptidoglycan hydrolase FlgJ [Sphingobacteriia bacterium]NCC38999.1 flagellar assembly peptidoglycan hydrolase FlgJ [Gammaproteobacteria bacterium]